MTTVNLGNLKFTWKGDWQASTLYNKDDIVKYGASAYVCTDSHTSTTSFAANSSKWDLMAEGISNAGVWNDSTLYQLNEVVTYGGAVYIALQENQNSNPYTNASDWQKFVDGQQFEGDWDQNTEYQKGDIVKYGGYAYVAKQNTVLNTPTNTTFWDVYVKGQELLGGWSSIQQYKPGEVVEYGGNRYIVKEGETPLGSEQAPDNILYWLPVISGFNWRNTWQSTEEYRAGDVVKFGGYIYICTATTEDNAPDVNPNFNLLTQGFNWRGVYSNSNSYEVGDIARVGGRTYICIASYDNDGSTLPEPPNSEYWEVFTDGFAWQGSWDVGTEYEVNDVVEYAQSSYISVANDNIGVTPGTDPASWELVAQGDSNAVLTTQGDIIFRDATQTTRLGIGPAGSTLVSNGSEPTWGHLTPQNDYYVSPQGDDTNDGRTAVTSWRTIKHACEQTFSLGQVRINVSAGVYEEQCPIRVGRSVVLEGNGLGAVTISPNNDRDEGFGVGVSDDGSTLNANSYVFHMNNGARLRNFVFRNFSTGSVMVSLDPGTGPDDTSVWITSQSPYVQNCTSFTPGGTGFKIDGALHNGGYKSMVANDWTQINSDGIGIHALNDGRTEIVSCFTYYCNIGYLAESGAKIRAIVGNNSYGEYGAVARGFSQLETPLTGTLQLDDETINSIETLSANVHIFTSFRDEVGNRFFVGHTNPTGTDNTSTFDDTASYPYIAKFNSAGSLDWSYTYENAFGAIHNVAELSDRIVAGGVIVDAATNKGFLLAISKAGEIQWQKIIGDTSEICDVTSDGNNLYTVGIHNTDGGVVSSYNPAGIERWSTTLEYTNGTNTLIPTSVAIAGTPTTSIDTYELAGDATAEGDIYIASRDTTENLTIITRVSNLGVYKTSYDYGDIHIKSLKLDTGNGDGIYLVAGGYKVTGGVNNPFMFRLSVDGTVVWQNEFDFGTEDAEFLDILPFGNDIYAAGYVNGSTNTYNRGFIMRLNSQGTPVWGNLTTNGTNNISFSGVMLDGVNVIAAGIEQGNGIIVNIQRDEANGIGTVSSGSYSLSAANWSISNATVVSKTVNDIDNASVTLGSTDSTLALNQSPGINKSIFATRDGFAGIGTGVVFAVDNLSRRPKEGSVLQIAGDDETYFVIGVDNFLENAGVLNDNNPNAVASLTNNKVWIQDETIGWIADQIANATPGSIWDGFTYNDVTCKRDVGLIVDALITDLDSSIIGTIEQNDASIDAAESYWQGATSQVAGQEAQTAAALTYMKGLVGNAMDKSAPAQTYSVQVQDTSHSAVEAGTQTFAEDRVDIVVDVVENGVSVLPVRVATGTASIQIDPAIPSNKTPNDNTTLTFREAFSQVRMTGHDFLDIGTGGFADTNYPVIIAEDYTQPPNQDRETLAEDGGRVFYVTTDQDGNFRVGDYFKVEQATGRATLSSEEFDLAGLNELQLGSITAGKQGATINEFSTDGTFADNSDTAVPTEKATKTYVDQEIAILSANASTIQAGSDPTQSKVEVTGTGATTDTIDFDIAGTTVSQIGQQFILVPAGTTGERPGTPANGYIRYNTEISAFEGYSNGQWSGLGGGNPWVTKNNTDGYTAQNNDRIFVDTSTAQCTITLPATPSEGDTVRFVDKNGTFATHNLVVARNGSNIMGLAEDLVSSTNGEGFALVYASAARGWIIQE